MEKQKEYRIRLVETDTKTNFVLGTKGMLYFNSKGFTKYNKVEFKYVHMNIDLNSDFKAGCYIVTSKTNKLVMLNEINEHILNGLEVDTEYTIRPIVLTSMKDLEMPLLSDKLSELLVVNYNNYGGRKDNYVHVDEMLYGNINAILVLNKFNEQSGIRMNKANIKNWIDKNL